jgi:hypothetical protein
MLHRGIFGNISQDVFHQIPIFREHEVPDANLAAAGLKHACEDF